MINLENLLIWDDTRLPVRVPKISVRPEKLSAAAEDGWIVAGPYRIKIIVEGTAEAFKVLDPNGNAMASSVAGSMFIDDSMFAIEARNMEGFKALGSVRGCVDISW